ncbi:hypothetical protein [Rhizobium sp. S152]|uniref:hypothetical protein n=1 Tax=Rhizobium sp. S152 TaxID=3055038 RepID=UPI0025A9CF52|nr:hypothetical protein [Rhizobium sp. S152]
MTLKIGKNAIAAFRMKAIQLVFEKRFEIHSLLQYRASVFANRGPHVNPLRPQYRRLRQKAHRFELF